MSKIITMSELQNRSRNDLDAMHRKAHEELVRSKSGSTERRNALASLENIKRALNTMRAFRPPPF